jgi:membrane-associated protease RseP (regulator of RpoE activity)
MSYCERCGSKLPPEARFCVNCGTPVAGFAVFPPGFSEVREAVEQHFAVEDAWVEDDRFAFNVRAPEVKSAFLRVRDRLMQLGFLPFLRRRAGKLRLLVVRRPPVRPARRIWNLILFLATVGTTIFAGYNLSTPLVEMGFMSDPWLGALTFSAAIMGVLGCHELGHKFMADIRGVEASLPYFIPVPFFIGTMGAVIQTRTPASNRDTLFDVGAAGPIAGFLALLPVTVLGLYWSYPIPAEAVPPGTIGLPTPVLLSLLLNLVGPPMLENAVILFHPVAFASWVGMLVTMLNLMPVGMLDGGHIARAVLGEHWHRVVSFAATIITFMLGWTFMAVLMLFFSLARHTGPLDDATPLTGARKVLSIGVFVLLFLCAVPGWQIRV